MRPSLEHYHSLLSGKVRFVWFSLKENHAVSFTSSYTTVALLKQREQVEPAKCLPITAGIAYLFFCGSSFFEANKAPIQRQRGMCVQTSVGTNMDSLLRENRIFPPPAEFASKARITSLEQYEAMYRRSVEEPEAFWAEAAGELEWLRAVDRRGYRRHFARRVVHRRQVEPEPQLRGPARQRYAAGQTRSAVGG